MPHKTDDVEDWFDDEATQSEDLEFSRLQSAVWKEGYKQGVSDAKSVALQPGFEEGFARCENLSLQIGELKGCLFAFQQFRPTDSPQVHSIPLLLKEIEGFVEQAAKLKVDRQPTNLAEFSEILNRTCGNLLAVGTELLSKGSLLMDPNPT